MLTSRTMTLDKMNWFRRELLRMKLNSELICFVVFIYSSSFSKSIRYKPSINKISFSYELTDAYSFHGFLCVAHWIDILNFTIKNCAREVPYIGKNRHQRFCAFTELPGANTIHTGLLSRYTPDYALTPVVKTWQFCSQKTPLCNRS